MQDFRMETFLTVCKYLNYTKAAQELNLTQPAVSQHIRYLENFYQVQLFYHAGKKVELTRAGELLRNSALTFKHDEIYLMRMLQDTAKNTRNFAFGATLSVAEFMLPPDLERLICAYPQSHIRMEVGNTRELLSKLDAGELDFAVVEGEFPREEYEFLLYRKEPYVPVASRKKAEQYRNAEFRELLSERLILREPGSGTREILERELRRRGMTTDDFSQITELGNIGAIQAMLRANLGISFFYQVFELWRLCRIMIQDKIQFQINSQFFPCFQIFFICQFFIQCVIDYREPAIKICIKYAGQNIEGRKYIL